MMKRILCLLAVLTFGFVFSAAAEEAAEPVTAAELGTLLDRVLAEALTEAPLNDPAEESAQDEDGTCFWYENAKIYADSTELTADTPVNALVFESLEGPIFRGTGMDTRTEDLLAAYPQDNYDLSGTREEAVRRYESQIRPDRQIAQATMVIMNDGTIAELDDKITELLDMLEAEHAA